MSELVTRILFPLSLVVAVALWAKAYVGVGDGFSAGAVAGLGAVMQYVALDYDEARRRVAARWVWWFVTGGLVLVLAVALAPVLAGEAPVTHAPAPGADVVSVGVIEVHTAALFDLGAAALVYGAIVGTFDRLFPPIRGGEP